MCEVVGTSIFNGVAKVELFARVNVCRSGMVASGVCVFLEHTLGTTSPGLLCYIRFYAFPFLLLTAFTASMQTFCSLLRYKSEKHAKFI